MKFPLLPAVCVAVAVWFSSPVSAVAQTTIYTSSAMSGAVGNESLGFTPLNGNIYTLSFSLLNSNVDENLVIGFATSTTPGDSFADAWWNAVRTNRADGNYAAPICRRRARVTTGFGRQAHDQCLSNCAQYRQPGCMDFHHFVQRQRIARAQSG